MRNNADSRVRPLKLSLELLVLTKYLINISYPSVDDCYTAFMANEWIHEWWCTRIGIRMSLDRLSRTYNDPPCTFRAASDKPSKAETKEEHTKMIWKKRTFTTSPPVCTCVQHVVNLFIQTCVSFDNIQRTFFPPSFLFRYIFWLFFCSFCTFNRFVCCWGFVNISFRWIIFIFAGFSNVNMFTFARGRSTLFINHSAVGFFRQLFLHCDCDLNISSFFIL